MRRRSSTGTSLPSFSMHGNDCAMPSSVASRTNRRGRFRRRRFRPEVRPLRTPTEGAMPDTAFRGKGVVVTGAGSGIGYATAKRFADAGAIVGVNDVNPERAYDAARDFNGAGGE